MLQPVRYVILVSICALTIQVSVCVKNSRKILSTSDNTVICTSSHLFISSSHFCFLQIYFLSFLLYTLFYDDFEWTQTNRAKEPYDITAKNWFCFVWFLLILYYFRSNNLILILPARLSLPLAVRLIPAVAHQPKYILWMVRKVLNRGLRLLINTRFSQIQQQIKISPHIENDQLPREVVNTIRQKMTLN